MRDGDRTMTKSTPADRHRTLRLLGVLVGLSAALGACTNTGGEVVTASIPDDYRQRHPIAIQEADRSIVIFVGLGRGGLSSSQRADVMGLAQTWAREGTGAIVADVPVETPNARAAAASFREVQAVLAASGVPSRGITMRHYRPDDPRTFATIRLSYPRIAAVAGPCGLWPDNLGPSILNRDYSENKPYYNFGCAYQRNMAAMIDNPSDLVQPRSETPPYTMRRSEAFERYRKSTPTTTNYPEAEKAKLSDTGK
jgi:pilus assembly protein CpaD